jgi:HAD superfamily hydrolase (TIGR01509 family)
MEKKSPVGQNEKKYRIKAVIFDMDVLILDTAKIDEQTLEKLLRAYGKESNLHKTEPTPESIAGATYYENFKAKYDLPGDVATIQAKKREILHEEINRSELAPFPGFIQLLNFFKKENFLVAVASNRGEDTINLVLEKLGVKNLFDVVVGTTETRRNKPFPDLYIHTAQELKVDPKNCIVLEDSEQGIISAREAGMKVIAVPNVYAQEQNLAKADMIIKSLLEINKELLKSL